MGSHSLLQGIFPIQESNMGLLHCRWIPYHVSHQGSPKDHPRDHPKKINITLCSSKFALAKQVILLWHQQRVADGGLFIPPTIPKKIKSVSPTRPAGRANIISATSPHLPPSLPDIYRDCFFYRGKKYSPNHSSSKIGGRLK